MKTKHNTITIFSNGIGHFRRVYKVPSTGLKITIPVNSNDLSDALESLTVFGDGIKLDSPPSFAPTNNESTALDYHPEEGFSSLLRNLAGAEVLITRATLIAETPPVIRGTLVGCEVVESEEKTYEYVIVESSGVIHRIQTSSIKNLEFTQDTIKSEISKALKKKFNKIKPNSTMIELSVSSKNGQETEAIVYYKVPVASWKMRFSVRQDAQQSVLEGCAIVDNNTEEDWQDFIVSVVTGNPISFRTDYGLITVPNREFIRIVDETGLSNVALTGGSPRARKLTKSLSESATFAAAACSSRSSYYNSSNACLESISDDDEGEFTSVEEMAESPGVDAKDVGDFCIFTAKEPVSIQSRRSAIIPMFVHPLQNVADVLVYKHQNHSTRPYRAFKFKNETPYSLSKGKVVFYQGGIFSGEAIMEATKPGDNRTLPYCLENGVRVYQKFEDNETTQSSLRLAKGFGVEEFYEKAGTTYSIENRKNEKFKFVIEHPNLIDSSQVTVYRNGVVDHNAHVIMEKMTSQVWRVYFNLEPNEKVEIKLHESVLRSRKFNVNLNWVLTNSESMGTTKFSRCLDLSKSLDDVNNEIRQIETSIKDTNEQTNRLRENLKATNKESANDSNDKIRRKWLEKLDECDSSIDKLQKNDLVEAKKKKVQIEKQIADELEALVFSSAKGQPAQVKE